jgi:hypothetical protein
MKNPPSARRARKEAIRRVRKAARKQAQRDGLIPMPKRREDVRRYWVVETGPLREIELGNKGNSSSRALSSNPLSFFYVE